MERKQIDIEISRTESRFKCLYYSRLTFTFASTPSRIVLIDWTFSDWFWFVFLLINCIRIHSCLAVLQWTKKQIGVALVPLVWMDRSKSVWRTRCVFIIWFITIRKNVRLRALVWNNLFSILEQSERKVFLFLTVIRSVSVICLQLSCLFNKRELGNRYGPF
jgi:hypothetical protein